MSPRTGRPKAEDPRRHVVQFRLTDAEKNLIEQAAGDIQIGPWVRAASLAAARRAVSRARRAADQSKEY